MAKTDWAAVRAMAETIPLTNVELAKIFGVDQSGVAKKRKAEGWKKLDVELEKPAEPAVDSTLEKTELENTTGKTQDELVKDAEFNDIENLINAGVLLIKTRDDLKGSDYKSIVEANKELWNRKKELLGITKDLPDAASKYIKKEDKRKIVTEKITATTPFKPTLRVVG